MIGTTAAILGAAALGAGATMYGASQASDAQNTAAENANYQQNLAMGRMRNDLSPYMAAGTQSLAELQQRMPWLTSEVKPLDQAGLENLPGYQFARTQGLRAGQNQLTASGLGRSGAAVKAAERFGTGLADQTYMGQANYVASLEMANRKNAFDRYMKLVDNGQNAAMGVGNAGMQSANQIGSNMIGAGNATGAAWMSGAGAVNNFANSAGSYGMFNQMMSQKGMYNGSGPETLQNTRNEYFAPAPQAPWWG